MKTKILLIAISLTAFLFTSCEKGEMEQGPEEDKGLTGGGGMGKATDSPIITLDSDAAKSYPDSLLYTSDDKLSY